MNRRDLVRGALMLLMDAVEAGSVAIEGVQKNLASRPFKILAQIPVIGLPAQLIELCYNSSLSSTHSTIRAVNRLGQAALRL